MRFSARGSRLLAAGVVTLTFAAFLHVPALSQSPFAARQCGRCATERSLVRSSTRIERTL